MKKRHQTFFWIHGKILFYLIFNLHNNTKYNGPSTFQIDDCENLLLSVQPYQNRALYLAMPVIV